MNPCRGYLLLRRGGGVWGIASERVTGLAKSGAKSGENGAAYRVTTAEAPLAADEILGVAAELAVRPPARAVARFWPAGSDGCAVWSGLPVAVVDPLDPPRALRVSADEGEPNRGD
jgi:hypothetical protein